MTLEAILRAVVLLSENGWAAIAVKATVGMIAAMLLVRIASRAAASLRHLVVAATFGVLLLLPVAAVLVPALVVRVPVPPRRPGVATSSLAAVAAAPTATLDAPRSSPQPGQRRNLVALASGAYAAGAAALILSLLVGIWAPRSSRKRTTSSCPALAAMISALPSPSTPSSIRAPRSQKVVPETRTR